MICKYINYCCEGLVDLFDRAEARELNKTDEQFIKIYKEKCTCLPEKCSLYLGKTSKK